jgi:tRNA G18 (ribose-2'-O)-methylase SpoU
MVVSVSADDERLALFRAAADPDLARKANLFVAEGRLVLQRVIQAGRYEIAAILVSDAAHRALEADLAAVPSDIPIFLVPQGDIEAIAGYRFHRGCLGLVKRPAATGIEELIVRARTVVVIDSVVDADNVGALFRNASAFGADAVLLSPGSCDPLYRKAVRTSMAAVLTIPFARSTSWPDPLATLKQAGFLLAALTPRRPSVPLEEFVSRLDREARLALIFGTEGPGLSADVLAYADERVRIPMSSAVDSINVATASAITLSRLGRFCESPP